MFGLSGGRVEADTGVAYRVSNCGIRDFWVLYDDKEKKITDIRLSYTTLFS
jgi:hypothetical protein